ncbi:MAG TPA: hypothetical protein PKG54_15725 [Phycisphaerae bacterium]|jgi:hypothetical protein|nr:hypothetical protein [Phycisphaerae bacterium]HOB75963.1 hypothetical protein [Phycisphaerae bacterium]HOJ55836.1 hypothetical protein [Phycisphaerae bacterium]HOL27809.1 hypothetical protein [Phycisphaerae bacterium]HPP22262.1 hypothetical protein [Phycisphaerae bacterium]
MSAITNLAELRRRGLEILVRELGYADAMRFLLQYDTGYGDYTKERREFLPDWTVEEAAREADKLLEAAREREVKKL